MADGVVIVMPVEAVAHFFFIKMMIIAQPAHEFVVQVVLLLNAQVKLGAVARREHHTALHHRLRQQAFQRLVERIRRKRHAFSQRNRSRLVVDAES